MHADTAGTAAPKQQLAHELHKPIIRKFQKHDYIHLFMDFSWDVVLFAAETADTATPNQ